MTADELRAARQRLGMSQYALAKALGLTVRSISRWETGGHIRYQVLLRLALEALGHTPKERDG